MPRCFTDFRINCAQNRKSHWSSPSVCACLIHRMRWNQLQAPNFCGTGCGNVIPVAAREERKHADGKLHQCVVPQARYTLYSQIANVPEVYTRAFKFTCTLQRKVLRKYSVSVKSTSCTLFVMSSIFQEVLQK